MASKAHVENIVNERRLRPIYGKYIIDITIGDESFQFHRFCTNLISIFNR